MSGIRHFSQKNFTKRRFAARNRTRDPDDLSRLYTYRQSVKNLLSARICAARLIQLQADRPGCLFFCFFRRNFSCVQINVFSVDRLKIIVKIKIFIFKVIVKIFALIFFRLFKIINKTCSGTADCSKT